MAFTTFQRTMRDHRKALLWWSVGIFAYVLMVDAFWPFVESQQAQLEPLIDALPPEMLAIMGAGPASEIFSPAGYLKTRTFGWVVPIVVGGYAAALGARAIAGEEEDGTLDLVLAYPVSRARFVVEKFVGLATVVAVLGLVLFAATVVGDRIWDLGIRIDYYLAACAAAFLVSLVFGSMALAIGAAGGSRRLALGVVAGFGVAAFLVDSLGTLVEGLDVARLFSPFYYYAAADLLVSSLDWQRSAVLAAAIIVLAAAAVIGFRRRDIAV